MYVEAEVELKYIDVDQRSVGPLLGREQPSRRDRPLIRGVTGAYHGLIKRFGALLPANWLGLH